MRRYTRPKAGQPSAAMQKTKGTVCVSAFGSKIRGPSLNEEEAEDARRRRKAMRLLGQKGHLLLSKKATSLGKYSAIHIRGTESMRINLFESML